MRTMDSRMEQIKKFAENMTTQHPTHDFTHNLRVLQTVKLLAKQETRKIERLIKNR